MHILASNWQLPFLKKRKEKRKYVARTGIEPRTPDLIVYDLVMSYNLILDMTSTRDWRKTTSSEGSVSLEGYDLRETVESDPYQSHIMGKTIINH